MRLVRMLPARWQRFAREAATFGIVGGANTVINFVVFNALALTVFENGQLKATVVATIVATCSSYLMNRYWTYRDRPKSAMRREYLLFALLNTTGLAIELGVLAAAKYGLGIHGLLALNVADRRHRVGHRVPVLVVPHLRLPAGPSDGRPPTIT